MEIDKLKEELEYSIGMQFNPTPVFCVLASVLDSCDIIEILRVEQFRSSNCQSMSDCYYILLILCASQSVEYLSSIILHGIAFAASV